MERLGYIKNIEGIVNELGGKLMEKIIVKNTINPLNPTVCFIISPPPLTKKILSEKPKFKRNIFSVPGTDIPLTKVEDYFFSNQVGLCYPSLKTIPILKSNAAVLASALCE
jgi:hypothetical protein